jgi:hypothetical protein
MVTAGLWKRKDIDSLEASLYRKIMFLSNSISNKAVLNTMTSIRLAGEAIENLVKRTREDAERQKRITSFYDGKPEGQPEGKPKGGPRGGPKGEPEGNHWKKPKQKLYVPRIMAEMMLASTSNSTSINFGVGHLSHRHN